MLKNNEKLYKETLNETQKQALEKELAETTKGILNKLFGGKQVAVSLKKDLQEGFVYSTEGMLEKRGDQDDILGYKINGVSMDWYCTDELEKIADGLKEGDTIKVSFVPVSGHVVSIIKIDGV
jgi:hypothetical protein